MEEKKPGFFDWAKVVGWVYLELVLVVAATVGLSLALGERAGPASGVVFALGLLYIFLMFWWRLWKLRKRGATLWGLCVIGVLGWFFFQTVLLAAIALPNLQRFQFRARQSEAKIALAGIYGGETAMFSEYKKYVADLDAIGWVPPGERRFYYVGFPAACVPEGAKASLVKATDLELIDGREAEIEAFFRDVKKPGECKDPTRGFDAFAVGVGLKGRPLDVWHVDETKTLTNVQVGL